MTPLLFVWECKLSFVLFSKILESICFGVRLFCIVFKASDQYKYLQFLKDSSNF